MRRSMIVAGGALLLSACGTSAPITPLLDASSAPTETAPHAQNPYLGFAVMSSDACPCAKPDEASRKSSDYYILAATAFTPAGNDDASKPRSYDKADRTLLWRFLFGRNVNFTLQGALVIEGATIPLPLYAMSHNSNAQDGETFSTDLSLLSHDLYVRVTDSTAINATFSAVYTETTQSNVMSYGVQVAKTAVMAISPNAHMLTTLSKKSLQQQATIWDAALNKASAESIQEKISVAITPKDLKDGSYGQISLSIPAPDGNLDPAVKIGYWTIGASTKNMRRSLFSPDRRIDSDGWETSTAAVPVGVNANQVLNEYVGVSDDQTVEKFLKSGPVNDLLGTWSSATTGTDHSKLPSAAEAVCRGAVDGLYNLGLSSVDARLGLWAMVEGMSLPGSPTPDQVKPLKTACNPYIAPFKFKGT